MQLSRGLPGLVPLSLFFFATLDARQIEIRRYSAACSTYIYVVITARARESRSVRWSPRCTQLRARGPRLLSNVRKKNARKDVWRIYSASRFSRCRNVIVASARARALTLRMMRLVRCVIVKNDYNATGAGFFRACRAYYILHAKSIDNI